MNKEPLFLYLLRIILAFALFGFMMMLFWSSELLEKDVKYLRSDIEQLHRELQSARLEMQALKNDVVKIIIDDQKNDQQLLKGILNNASSIELLKQIKLQASSQPSPNTLSEDSINESSEDIAKKPESIELSLISTSSLEKDRKYIDPNLPNLLTEDQFSSTLPKTLGEDFKVLGKRRGAMVSRPPDLHPFRNESSVQSLVGLCQSSLSQMHFGKYETMAPALAIKIEERKAAQTGKIEFWVHLRRDVFWEPLSAKNFPSDFELNPWFTKRHKVSAHDFKFYVDAVQNKAVESAAPYRNYWGDIEELEVLDEETFIVRWKAEKKDDLSTDPEQVKYLAKDLTGSLKPLPCFVYKYFPDGRKIIEDDEAIDSYKNNSIWAQNFEQHWAKGIIVSCGPWVFDSINDERALFKKNQNYFDPLAVLVEEMEISFKSNPDSIWQDYKSGKLDTHSLQPDQLVELEEYMATPEYGEQEKNGMAIHRLDYLRRAYNYIGWNQATPFFEDKKVRQAVSMTIDVQRIIDQNLNGMGVAISGPFFINSPSNDANIKPYKYDLEKAKSLLEQAGWFDQDGDGIRDKLIHGQLTPFRFSLSYYVKNPVTRINCEYVATALKELGIDCKLNGLDISDLSNIFAEKNFDAIYFGWALGTPPETPRQLWHSDGAKENGSSNAVGFANSEADEIIERLDFEYNSEKRLALYHRFHEIVHEEAPYTFLYTPKTTMVYRDYLQNVFIPAQRQDLVPGANVAEPQSEIFWIKTRDSATQDMAYGGIFN
ncbi:MAG: ABC transporter substrate-binding protein [Chlamydiales bacterium]|nr:ABC transporter substrate-binding protein [Chlamydiales bacterium]